jgi:hypothetical protein
MSPDLARPPRRRLGPGPASGLIRLRYGRLPTGRRPNEASPAPGSPSGVAVDVACVEFGLLGVDAGYRYDFGVWMERGI